jgi:RimJ/RimL family protein N-acetyltransferase
VLADPARILLIGEMAGRPAGVVRFDIEAERAQVSIYRVPDRHEPGLGRDLLCAAEDWLRKHRTDVRRLIAVVLGDNRRSQRLFERAGYLADTTAYTKELN